MSRERRNLLIGLAAASVAIPACSSGSGGDNVAQSGPGSGAEGDGSALPQLKAKASLEIAPASEEHVAYAPAVPPAADRRDQRVFEVSLEVVEGPCEIDPATGVRTETWGYRVAGDTQVSCGVPGPVLRGRVGDLARITLANGAGNQHPHNIDFHAVTGQGGGAEALTVAPGETATIEARLLYPGAFMYHCAFAPVVEHIARGMVGMFIVDPEDPLPEVDHEWAVMQNEWYVTEPDESGFADYDPEALRREDPRFVTFNGRTDALIDDNALTMRVGERSRIFMINHGLNLNSNFHPIGSHWDTVYPEAALHPDNRTIRGSQSTLVVTGGGTIVEMLGLVPSTVLLVDHALVRTFLKGALGHVVVEGDPDEEVFVGEATSAGLPADPEPADPELNSVVIPSGAFDPANADSAFLPIDLEVPAGTTVTWTNRDSVVHTVTSGTSTGTVGTSDGIFDSGELAAGGTFTHTFDEPGEYPYYCTPHPWMIGSVTVS